MALSIQKATFDDFKLIVDLTRKLHNWEHSYDDYNVYIKAFGDENVKFLAAKNEGNVTRHEMEVIHICY